MGAWGYGIRQDDFVLDVIGCFEDLLKAGQSVRDATTAVKARFAAAIGDDDDGPLFWLALADVQWTYGELETDVLDRVRSDFSTGRGLSLWQDDARGLVRRTAALQKFIDKIAVPRRRTRKLPRTVIRAPKFRPGDCLSIRLASGGYGAALVLAADHREPEYGMNLIGILDYHAPHEPPIESFRTRTWRVRPDGTSDAVEVAWFMPVGFRSVASRLQVVGQIEFVESDPKDSAVYRGWRGIGEPGSSRR